ncbi:hypothetical protein BVX98_00225 [bacterium F11]|nr:hypothetical protein BVX98_00225 [bacterium F11]
MTKKIYLDHNSTSPLSSGVLEAMLPYLNEEYGNASSITQMGQRTRKAVEDARKTLAHFIGAEDPDEIVFTSCATESNNMAIKGTLDAYHSKGRRIVSSSIEHASVRNILYHLAEKGQIDHVVTPVQQDGLINLEAFEESLTPDTILVSMMAVNNETGVIQPIQEIAKMCKEKEVLIHSDAVQAAGKICIDVKEWGVDLLSLSAHKFGGPKGVGLLYIRKGTQLESLLHGGRHEKNRRAGTENVAGIVGMAKAAEIAQKRISNNTHVKELRDFLEEKVTSQISHTFVNGHQEKRISNTSNICFDYTDSSSLLMALDLKGVSCSNGSACATGSVEASHVLLAMGLPQHQAHAALRLSLGPSTTGEEISMTIEALKNCVQRIRDTHPLWRELVNK